MKHISTVLVILCLVMAPPALAEEVNLPGPDGPLGGKALMAEPGAPLIVIVPGSGPVDRDGNASSIGISSDSYRLLAEALHEHGISSIRIDKRGFFSSAQAIENPNDVTIAAYAQDLRDWIAHGTTLTSCVWAVGHSEGGLVALHAAQPDIEGLCGLILLATPGRPVGRLLVRQMQRNPMTAPLLPEIDSIVSALEAGQTRDPAHISDPLRPLFSEGLQRYMRDLFLHDPADYAANLDLPVMVVQGHADLQVFPEDADLLSTALPTGERFDLQDMTHMLKRDQPASPEASYIDPSLPLHPELAAGIAGFIWQHSR